MILTGSLIGIPMGAGLDVVLEDLLGESYTAVRRIKIFGK